MTDTSIGNRQEIAAFARSFYQNPDLQVDRLPKISSPVLVLLGEKDDLFIEQAKIMAGAIPNFRHIVIEGVGHLTAIEAPDHLAKELLSFLKDHTRYDNGLYSPSWDTRRWADPGLSQRFIGTGCL